MRAAGIDESAFLHTAKRASPVPLFPDFEETGLSTSGEAFRTMDRLLDGGLSGPLFLRRPEIAELVMQALLCGERRFHRYRLHAFVVMPNHVHLLVTPAVDSRRWLGPLKGFTSYK